MQIIDADPGRMIDLPGVGPCPRPVDIHQGLTGFRTLKTLRIYRFPPGVTIDGESEGDEVWIVPLDGVVGVSITGRHPLAARVAPGDALYMPPGHAYRLTPESGAVVAYARAEAVGRVATHLAQGPDGQATERLALRQDDLADGQRLDTDTARDRLVHVVAGRVSAGGQVAGAGQTVALARGEAAAVRAAGAARVLTISA